MLCLNYELQNQVKVCDIHGYDTQYTDIFRTMLQCIIYINISRRKGQTITTHLSIKLVVPK